MNKTLTEYELKIFLAYRGDCNGEFYDLFRAATEIRRLQREEQADKVLIARFRDKVDEMCKVVKSVEAENKRLRAALKLALSIISEGTDEFWQEENQDRIDACGDAAVAALTGTF